MVKTPLAGYSPRRFFDVVGQVVLSCKHFDETLSFFIDVLGFRIHSIYPADNPSVAELFGHGLHIRLIHNDQDSTVHLRLVGESTSAPVDSHRILTAPNGTRIEFAEEESGFQLPPIRPAFVITRQDGENAWNSGRAGMQYRDLIPCRLGGQFIASHIRIPEGGPVPDYVHFPRRPFSDDLLLSRLGKSRLRRPGTAICHGSRRLRAATP